MGTFGTYGDGPHFILYETDDPRSGLHNSLYVYRIKLRPLRICIKGMISEPIKDIVNETRKL